MQIDLTQKEIELIEQALMVWETDSISGALSGALIGAVYTPPEKLEERKIKMQEEMKKASEESSRRKREVILLRAKLIQGMNRCSEHEVT